MIQIKFLNNDARLACGENILAAKTSNYVLIGLVILIIVAGVVGYYAGSAAAPAVTKTVTAPAVGATVTVTQPVTVTAPVTITTQVPYKPPEKVKAAFIYVGPVGDFGWSYMHDLGRRVVAELYKDWLETTYVESVPEPKVSETLESLIAKGYNVFFTTSYGFMEGTLETAKKYPNLIFFHCSGYLRYKNMGTYFADFYQIYYLNGLMAGALTKTGKVGYVAAFLIPEVVRHLNAFFLGAKEVAEQRGIKLEAYVIEIGAWFNPTEARRAAETLVRDYNVDVIAFTEDSTAIIEYAQEMYNKGTPIYVFSHYSPGWEYGKDVVVSGQLVRWEVIYADILGKIKAGVYTPTNLENVDYWYLLNTGAVDMAAHVFPNGTVMHINPKFINVLKEIQVTDKVTGQKLSVYDLIWLRYNQMAYAPMLMSFQQLATSHIYENIVSINIGGKEGKYYIATAFEPFTGPLSGYNVDDPTKKVSIPAGVRLGHDELWSLDWVLDFVKIVGRAS